MNGLVRLSARGVRGVVAAVIALLVLVVGVGVAPAYAVVPKPPGAHAAGDKVTLHRFGGKNMRVTVVAPGIAVFQGVIRNGSVDMSDNSPSGEDPSNPDFLARLQASIQALQSTQDGARLVAAAGNLRQVPGPEETWGTNAASWLNGDGSISSINVVIGIWATPREGGYMSRLLDYQRAVSGLGTASSIAVDPTFPVLRGMSIDRFVGILPVVSIGHELIHAVRAAAGVWNDPAIPLYEWYGRTDQFGAQEDYSNRVLLEELYTLGNDATRVMSGPDPSHPGWWSSLLPADTAPARSLAVIRRYQQDHPDLSAWTTPVLRARESIAGTTSDTVPPTETRLSLQFGFRPRTHYTVYDTSTLWYIQGNPDEWIARQRSATSTQLLTMDSSLFSTHANLYFVENCNYTGAWFATICKTPQRPVVTALQWQLQGAQKCLRATAVSAGSSMTTGACQSSTDQKLTYHPDTKMLSAGDTDLTEAGKAPASPALCVTTAEYNQDPVRLQACSLDNARQKWAYSTSGMWMALDSGNAIYGCLSLYNGDQSDGARLVIDPCNRNNFLVWNATNVPTQLSQFKIASPMTGGTLSVGDKQASDSWFYLKADPTIAPAIDHLWSLGAAMPANSDAGVGIRNAFIVTNAKAGFCLTTHYGSGYGITYYAAVDDPSWMNQCAPSTAYPHTSWKIWQKPGGLTVIETMPYKTTSEHNGCLRAIAALSDNIPWDDCNRNTTQNTASKYEWRLVPAWAITDRADTRTPKTTL